jgi:NADH-quinone oxidoreductase subunit D
LTGRTEGRAAAWANGWLARLARYERRYLAVDGGGGARLLARLPALRKRLRPVSSPRHAEVLLACEPISRQLLPSLLELYRAMPRPRRAVVVGEPGPEHFPRADLVRLEDFLPNVERISADMSSPAEVEQRLLTLPLQFDESPSEPRLQPVTIPLPGKQEREIATELVVLSLGPVQPFPAGPLRLLLICDGEQIASVHIEAGYAARDVAGAMTRAAGIEIAELASALDPLAPVAGRLAYVTALEQLQHWEPEPTLRQQREAGLALERAQNHIAWLVRFAELLADDRLTDAARRLDASLGDVSGEVWAQSPVAWLAPQIPMMTTGDGGRPLRLERLAAEIAALRDRLARNRVLALRTAGIGVLPVDRLRAVGASGPALHASERGQGDVLGRLLARLDEAADDVRNVEAGLKLAPANRLWPAEQGIAQWSAPPGKTEVAIPGPRGHIGLSLAGDGDSLHQVAWRRPSAALLRLLPELLAGQKLADAEVIIASLDLAMAEADG